MLSCGAFEIKQIDIGFPTEIFYIVSPRELFSPGAHAGKGV